MRDLAPATISQIQRSTNFNHNDVLNVNILDEAAAGDDASMLLGLFPNLTFISVNGVVRDDIVFDNVDDIPTEQMPANSLLIFTGNVDAGDIATFFDALNIAKPANIILTQQEGTVPADAFRAQLWLQSFRADGMTSIPSSVFYSCTRLVSVSLPSATSIGNTAFFNCNKLASLSLPSAIDIGAYTFRACTSLVSVYLPSATTIGNNAFFGCTALPSVSLPSATSIGTTAFTECTQHIDVYLSEPLYTTACNTGSIGVGPKPIWGGTNITLHLYTP